MLTIKILFTINWLEKKYIYSFKTLLTIPVNKCINVILTINVIKVNHKCNTHHKCNKVQP